MYETPYIFFNLKECKVGHIFNKLHLKEWSQHQVNLNLELQP